MHLVEMKYLPILLLRIISLRDIHHIVVHVLLHHIPRPSAQTKAFALADGVKPESLVLTELTAGLKLHDGAGFLAEMTAYEVIIVDFAEKTYALAVAAICVGHTCLYGQTAHLGFGQVADRKHQTAELLIGYAT